MGFTKLDENIIRSSIMHEDPYVFKVWICLLAGCKKNGISDFSIPGIASHCFLTIEEVESAIEVLSSPDKYSRSINDEGRRIRRVDGGFEVINYMKYREYNYSDKTAAERQRRHREKEKTEDSVTLCHGNVTVSRNVTETSRDISASVSVSVLLESFNCFRVIYPGSKRGNETEFKNFKKHKDYKIALPLLEPAIKNQISWRSEMQAAGMFVPEYKNLQTWINQRCWEMEKPAITKPKAQTWQFS